MSERTSPIFVRVTRPDGTSFTLRLERQLVYVLERLPEPAGAMAALRRRLKRIWEQDAGLPWPPAAGCWEVQL